MAELIFSFAFLYGLGCVGKKILAKWKKLRKNVPLPQQQASPQTPDPSVTNNTAPQDVSALIDKWLKVQEQDP